MVRPSGVTSGATLRQMSLTAEQRGRMKYVKGNVLTARTEPADGLAEVARYVVPTSKDLEDRETRETILWRVLG